MINKKNLEQAIKGTIYSIAISKRLVDKFDKLTAEQWRKITDNVALELKAVGIEVQ